MTTVLIALVGLIALVVVAGIVAIAVRTYKDLEGIYKFWLVFCLIATVLIIILMIKGL